jgi:hypothetical protein
MRGVIYSEKPELQNVRTPAVVTGLPSDLNYRFVLRLRGQQYYQKSWVQMLWHGSQK